MRPRLTRVLAALVALAALAPGGAGAEQPPSKRLYSIEDLYRFDGPTSVQVAPNGHEAVYVRHWIDRDSRQDRYALWLAVGNRDTTRSLEAGEPDGRAPVWSPDGKWIVFLSTRARPHGWRQTPPVPPESEPATDIWLIPATGGTAIPLSGPDKPYGRVFNDWFYGRVAFAPDGRTLVFIADDGKDPRTPAEMANDVQVVRPDQGEGYTGYRPAQIWLAHLDQTPGPCAARRIERLTDDDVWYGDPQWSPAGRTVVVHANKTPDREAVRYSINKNFDLWAIDVATHAARQLTDGPGPDVSPRFSPDGKRIAYLTIPRKGTHMDVFNLAVAHLDGKEPHSEVVLDVHSVRGSLPARAPAFPLPDGCWDDNEHIGYSSNFGVGSAFVRVAVPARGPAKATDASTAGTWAKRLRRQAALTPRANPLLRDRVLAPSRVVTWTNDQGRRLEGILTTPPESVARPPYKLLLAPHGGPHSRSALGFDFTTQVFAAQGYAVFQPNFRGSAGYGQDFIDADRFDFGGGDMRDILAGIDALVRRQVVDPGRQFVYGTSYGGFMTCWLVGHTNQFRAAVTQNAVTDLTAMWGLSDIQSWTEWEFGGRPWEVPGAMRDHSPTAHVANVRTPTLVLHSRDDRRCPLPMGRMFYQGLRARGVPTEMVIYPREGHAIKEPRHREDVLRRVLAWFAKYDKPPPRG